MPSKDRKKGYRTPGWEEAGGEFYQEAYQKDGQNTTDKRSKACNIEAMLPSRQVDPATLCRKGFQNATFIKTKQRKYSAPYQTLYATTTFKPEKLYELHAEFLPDLASEDLANEEETWQQLEDIKSLAIPMSKRRSQMMKLKSAPSLRIGGWAGCSLQLRKSCKLFQNWLGSKADKLCLWQSIMYRIEGRFGMGVVSYFKFIRWLLLLNMFLGLMTSSLIVLPYFLLRPSNSSDVITDCLLPNTNESVSVECCSLLYQSGASNFSENSVWSVLLDTIEGRGWLEFSPLFYGYYAPYILELSPQIGLSYNFPLAYLLTIVSYFFLCFVLIVRSEAHCFKESLLSSKGNLYILSYLVFGGWDHCITNHSAAKVKRHAIFNEIQAFLIVEHFKLEQKLRSQLQCCRLLMLRLLVNVLVLGGLLGCGYLIYFSVILSLRNDLALPGWLLDFLPSLTICFLNLFVPIFWSLVSTVERYSPVVTLKLTLLRTVFIKLSSVVVLMITFYKILLCDDEPTPIFSGSMNCSRCNAPLCWETYVGQHIYRLLLVSFALQLVKSFIVGIPRRILTSQASSKITKLLFEVKFDLPMSVLDLVYEQTLYWLGSFYAPLMPVLGIVLNVLLFYIKVFHLYCICTPTPIFYQASKSKGLFIGVLLLSFLVTIIPVGFSIAEVTPSKSCGPFRGLDTIWVIVMNTVQRWPSWVKSMLHFFTTAAFIVPAFILLALGSYYYWALSFANHAVINMLRNQLVLEGKDKQFLLQQLNTQSNDTTNSTRSRSSHQS